MWQFTSLVINTDYRITAIFVQILYDNEGNITKLLKDLLYYVGIMTALRELKDAH